MMLFIEVVIECFYVLNVSGPGNAYSPDAMGYMDNQSMHMRGGMY